MTLHFALTASLRDLDAAELDEARALLGAGKLDLRRRLSQSELWNGCGSISREVQRYNNRIDEINQEYCDRQLDEGKRRKERLDRERRERNGNG